MNITRCVVILIVALLIAGCAAKSAGQRPAVPALAPSSGVVGPAKGISKGPAKPTKTAGIIFGKADFQGILKVQYVKLNIVDELDPAKQYELLFGDRDENNSPVWDARPVEPHYFFLELPVGKYRITAISIPVGTTLATEPTDIAFTVQNETVIYLGTLRVTGTDQKIRFGGVPLLRPGFEYRVEILNEKEEALREFKLKYPLLSREIQVQLMRTMRIQTF